MSDDTDEFIRNMYEVGPLKILRFDGRNESYDSIRDKILMYTYWFGSSVYIRPDGHGKRSGGNTTEVSDLIILVENPTKPTEEEFNEYITGVSKKFFKLDKEFIYNKYNLNKVIERLGEKMESRRAVFSMFTTDQIDSYVHCISGGQFLVRDGKVSLRVWIRSNDAYNAAILNVMEFTYALHCIAEDLGLTPGHYVQYATSMHVYDMDFVE